MVDALLFFALLTAVSVAAGYMGSLTGLGGATFLVPIYVLFLGMPIQYAAGANFISTIATSSGVVLLGSIYTQVARSRHELPDPKPPDRWTMWLQLCGRCYDHVLGREVEYCVVRWWLGELIMFAAGVVSGLLGIGSGALKMVAMDWAMNLPIKVSTATSNFMIGVTAVVGSSIYWSLGYIQPFFAATTAIGVLAGSFMGSKVLLRLRSATIRHIFTVILAALGIQMLLSGLGLY
jgi:uncharacterized membrane protein YfcA